jgi:hypothetical protein
MFTAIARQHAVAGQPVTAATLTRMKATLRAALNAAVRAGYLPDNPARHIQPPPAHRPCAAVWTSERIAGREETGIRPPVAVWTAAQTAAFLNAIRSHRLYAAFHLIALRACAAARRAGCAGATSTWTPAPRSSAGSCRNTTATLSSPRLSPARRAGHRPRSHDRGGAAPPP